MLISYNFRSFFFRMFCSVCGARNIVTSALFCGSCGARYNAANAASSPCPSSAPSSLTFEEFMTQREAGQGIFKSALLKADKKKKEERKLTGKNMKTRDQQVQVKFARLISFQIMPMSFPPIVLWFNCCS